MKIIYIAIICSMFISCRQKKREMSSFRQEIQVEKKSEETKIVDVIHQDEVMIDTIIGKYHINYTITDNSNLIGTYPVVDNKGLDTIYFSDRDVFLSVEFDKKAILENKKLNKFAFNIPESERYQLNYFDIDEVKVDRVTFIVNFCMPESDICYWFEYVVLFDGRVEIVELDY